MNTDLTESQCAQFPMNDYDALEREVCSTRERLKILEPQYAAMTEQLDRITSPVHRIRPEPLKISSRGFEFRGQFVAQWSCIGIHRALMRRLWTEFPQHRDAMAKAAGRTGRSRSYVARTPVDLFPDRSPEWSRQHSCRLMDGWFIDTNMNPKQMRTILRSVVAAAGLEWGKDVKVVWRAVC
jgi:hypothetical protein